MTKQKAVLVAGGAGFLGSFLCDHYIKASPVVCVDNLVTGSQKNIEHLLGNPDFTFINADIISPLSKEITEKEYRIILNMASPASPPHYQRLSIETLQVGSVGTLSLLELARSHKARFFHASTSEVYGDPEVHPQPESYVGCVNCYGPRAMYDEAKRYAEALIFAYRDRYPEVSTCIGRFFNTYGPRMDPNDGRVVSNFIVQALQNKPLTVYGNGDQTRSFCYVSDLVEGITRLVDSEESKPMNLGNPGEFTILELTQKILSLIPESTSSVTHKPAAVDDPKQRKPDIGRAQTALGWEPNVELSEGLVPTIAYFASRLTSLT